MATTKINISLTDVGANVLHAHGLDPNNYKPAYNGESVGLDLYNAGPDVVLHGRNKWVAFGEEKSMIPTGVRIALPLNTVALVKERGSIIGTGLLARAGVIDPGYTDEIFVNLVNLGERDTTIPAGAKLPVQLLILPCLTEFNVISKLEFLNETKDAKRKSGSLGSTNRQNEARTEMQSER